MEYNLDTYLQQFYNLSKTEQSTFSNPTELSEKLLHWYDISRRKLPWRGDTDKLEDIHITFPNPYGTWVSEIMLQQTRVETVIPYWIKWMKQFPTISSLAESTFEDINKYWAGLGYYRRAQLLLNGAKFVEKEYNGELPTNITDLLKIPGIGPYTAGAIASIAFSQPTPLVDGNVMRVFSRLQAILAPVGSTEMDKISWSLADSLMSSQRNPSSPSFVARPGDLNQALMELGATVCTPSKPNCTACPLQLNCLARKLVDYRLSHPSSSPPPQDTETGIRPKPIRKRSLSSTTKTTTTSPSSPSKENSSHSLLLSFPSKKPASSSEMCVVDLVDSDREEESGEKRLIMNSSFPCSSSSTKNETPITTTTTTTVTVVEENESKEIIMRRESDETNTSSLISTSISILDQDSRFISHLPHCVTYFPLKIEKKKPILLSYSVVIVMDLLHPLHPSPSSTLIPSHNTHSSQKKNNKKSNFIQKTSNISNHSQPQKSTTTMNSKKKKSEVISFSSFNCPSDTEVELLNSSSPSPSLFTRANSSSPPSSSSSELDDSNEQFENNKNNNDYNDDNNNFDGNPLSQQMNQQHHQQQKQQQQHLSSSSSCNLKDSIRFLFVKRPFSGLLANQWEFPSFPLIEPLSPSDPSSSSSSSSLSKSKNLKSKMKSNPKETTKKRTMSSSKTQTIKVNSSSSPPSSTCPSIEDSLSSLTGKSWKLISYFSSSSSSELDQSLLSLSPPPPPPPLASPSCSSNAWNCSHSTSTTTSSSSSSSPSSSSSLLASHEIVELCLDSEDEEDENDEDEDEDIEEKETEIKTENRKLKKKEKEKEKEKADCILISPFPITSTSPSFPSQSESLQQHVVDIVLPPPLPPITHIFSHQKHTYHPQLFLLQPSSSYSSSFSSSSTSSSSSSNSSNSSRETRWMSASDIEGVGISTGCKKILDQVLKTLAQSSLLSPPTSL